MSVEEASTSPLDRPADLASLRELHQAGLLTDEAFVAARAIVLPRSVWREWASRHLLMLGVALLLSGIVFFFAYNWQAMGRLTKLGLAALGIVACAGASEFVGRKRLGGKILVLSASVLVGVLLAIFGQVYQTGADPYELFVGWASLILVWVLITDLAALWLIWLVIVHFGAILYWDQVVEPQGGITFDVYFILLTSVDLVALALREYAVRIQNKDWLAGIWFQACLVIASLFFGTMPVLAWIVGSTSLQMLGPLSLFFWLAMIGAGFYVYRFVLREVPPLSLIVLDVCVVLCTFLIDILFDSHSWSDAGPYLLSGFIILAVAGGAAVGLKFMITAMAKERQQDLIQGGEA